MQNYTACKVDKIKLSTRGIPKIMSSVLSFLFLFLTNCDQIVDSEITCHIMRKLTIVVYMVTAKAQIGIFVICLVRLRFYVPVSSYGHV